MEALNQDELKAHLMQTNEEFRQLAAQHAELKKQVEAIEAKARLTEEDELEEVRIKKQKLHLKDQMAGILNRYKTEHATV
jgi:uncharacterized protein YdcH (DUF465 family)